VKYRLYFRVIGLKNVKPNRIFATAEGYIQSPPHRLQLPVMLRAWMCVCAYINVIAADNFSFSGSVLDCSFMKISGSSGVNIKHNSVNRNTSRNVTIEDDENYDPTYFINIRMTIM
jgi:hypothetical protein